MAIDGDIKPGDVLTTRSGGAWAWLIRVGAALRDHPNISNHVAVAHHTDGKGTLWCIEGRPSGAGWRDATAYTRSRWTLANTAQPKTAAQRAAVCEVMLGLIGTDYDWQAIMVDAAAAFGIKVPGWEIAWDSKQVPGHVVCSSLASYGYAKARLTCPAGARSVTPGDWDEFILAEQWKHPGPDVYVPPARLSPGGPDGRAAAACVHPGPGRAVNAAADWLARHRKLVVFAVGAALTVAAQAWGSDNAWVSLAVAVATGLGIYQVPNRPAPGSRRGTPSAPSPPPPAAGPGIGP